MKLSDFIEISELRELCESFTALTNAVTAILDLEGNILIATGWKDICTRFHRVHPLTAQRCKESDTILAGQLQCGEQYNVYKCKNGLVDVAVPLIVEGHHIANFFTGQFFFEPPDKEFFIRQANEYGFEKAEYLEALDKVPIFSEGQVRALMKFFTRLMLLIVKMGLAHKRQNEILIKLQENQQRLNFHVDNSPMATVEWDSEYMVTRWAGEAEKIFGWTQTEIIGKRIMDLHLIYEKDHLIVLNTMKQLSEGHSKYVVSKNRNYTKDGHIITCEWYNTVLTDAQGKMVSVLSQVLDITERIRHERYREMAQEVLQILNESGNIEELLPQVVTSLKKWTEIDAVAIRLKKDDDYPYLVSEGFTQEFITAENTLAQRTEDGMICRDSTGNVSLECICGLVLTGRGDTTSKLFTKAGSFWTNNSFSLLETSPDKDPRNRPRNVCIHHGFASIALVPIRDGGQIVGLIQFNNLRKDFFTIDMVEQLEEIATYIGAVLMRQRSENERLVLQQQLQQSQKLESLGMMTSGIAHDFNNILAIITGNCFLAKKHPDAAEANITAINIASERAAELCRQMQAFTGKAQFMQTPLDFALLLGKSVEKMKASLPRNIEINLTCTSAESIISGDDSQLNQIIKHLITNASEAIGEKQGNISMVLSQSNIRAGQVIKDHQGQEIKPGCYACLDVSDNGCGMDNDTIKRIFEPFFSTKFIGRGLGLSATIGIITAQSGAIQVSSALGKGTAFKVFLPLHTVRSGVQQHKVL